MPEVMRGRYTAAVDQPFVVFLIGMRINNWLAISKWFTTMRAMVPMLRALAQNKESGFLGRKIYFFWPGVMLVQYWRSFDALEAFARDREQPHLSAWQRFNRSIGSDGTVGFWHETYLVQPEDYEVVYVNMPVWGLAQATEQVPAVGQRETARRRLGGESAPAVPTPAGPASCA
jgi:Monooxygenase af470-like